MEFALDKALKEMSIEDEKPLVLKNNPKFCSLERNTCSLMGRLLNPEMQRMSSMILDMPRVWRLYSRVRGVALSNERFQFIFDSEEDLQGVLQAGAWTYDDWSMVLEKWVEKPPDDFLKILPIWVRLRNIPVNHYTAEAIEQIADRIGVVKVVAFDPLKPQRMGYERVLVLFDTSRALKNSIAVMIDSGEVVHVGLEYERVRKRCFQCKRLTHDKSRCPFNPLNRHLIATEGFKLVAERVGLSIPKISSDDPLYGVLTDDDVGIDLNTGRPKIAKDVLDVMRNYLCVTDPSEKQARILRVRKSVWDLDGDTQGQKILLRLEGVTEFTTNRDKGKGLVFQFGENGNEQVNEKGEKLTPSAIGPGSVLSRLSLPSPGVTNILQKNSVLHFTSTVKGAGSFGAGSSGSKIKTGKTRRRPNQWKRKAQNSNKMTMVYQEKRKELRSEITNEESVVTKRKAADEAEVPSKIAKRNEIEVVPHEEPPTQL